MRQALRKFIKNSIKTGASELRTIHREEHKKYKSLVKERERERDDDDDDDDNVYLYGASTTIV